MNKNAAVTKTSKLGWHTGVKDAFPIVLGYLPLGFAFGVLAKDTGMTIFQATAMSLFCFTGAGQYVAIGILKAGGAVVTVIMANILVNLRYLLFSASTVPYLKNRVSPYAAALLSYGLTDETYAVAMNRYRNQGPTLSYLAGLNLTAHVGWIGSTLIGALAGSYIVDTESLGLGFALPAMYTCLLVLMVTRKPELRAALTSALICLAIGYFFPQTLHNLSNIIMATVLGATLGVIWDGKN